MAYPGVYQLLMDALQERRPGMASDDPAEVARRYLQGEARDGWNWDAEARYPQPVDVPPRDQQVRQLSLAPFAARALDKSNAPLSLLDDHSTVPLQSARQADAYAAGPTLTWAAGMPLPMPGGRFSAIARGLSRGPFPTPPESSEFPKIPMPEMPPALKLWWEVMKLHPEFVLKFGLPGGIGNSSGADTAVAPIDELQARGKRNAKSKGPTRMQGAPSTVPDAGADAAAAAAAAEEAKDLCYQRYLKEVKRCQERFPNNRLCEQNAMTRMAQCYGNNGFPPLDEKEIYDGEAD